MNNSPYPKNPIDRQFAKLSEIYQMREKFSRALSSTPEYKNWQKKLRGTQKQVQAAKDKARRHSKPDENPVLEAERLAEENRKALEEDLNSPKAYWNKLRRKDHQQADLISGFFMSVSDWWHDFVGTDVRTRLEARDDVRNRKDNVRGLERKGKRERDSYNEDYLLYENLNRQVQELTASWQRQKDRQKSWEDSERLKTEKVMKAMALLEEGRIERLRSLLAQPQKAQRGTPKLVPWGQLIIDKRHSLPIPRNFAKGAPLACRTKEERLLIENFLANLLEMSAPKAVRIIGVDTQSLGSAFRDLNTSSSPLLEGGGFISQTNGIANRLAKLVEDMSALRRTKLGSQYEDWASYRDAHPSDTTPYTILLVHGAERLLLRSYGDSTDNLLTLLENGTKHGILVILSFGELTQLGDKEREKVKQIVRRYKLASPTDVPSSLQAKIKTFPNANLAWKPVKPGSEEKLRKRLEQCAERNAAPQHALDELWDADAVPSASSVQGLRIPLGWSAADGGIACLQFGDQVPHAFVGGQTGSGKSNLLHVIIHSLLAHYGEDEVNLYLMDFKSGTEMTPYAHAGIPAIKLVASSCDREFAQSVLEHFVGENERRAKLFRDTGSNYATYRRDNPGVELPRIVIMVDECQSLLNQGSYKKSQDVGHLLDKLARQGRSQGIHLLLSSQDISSETTSNTTMWHNIPGRIALFCREEVCRKILGGDNLQATRITAPTQAVLNLESGRKGANVIVDVPLAKQEVPAIREHMRKLSVGGAWTRVYDGAALDPLPSHSEFRRLCSSSAPVLLLGKTKDWEAKPYILDLAAEDAEKGYLLKVWMTSPEPKKGFLAALRRSVEASSVISSVEAIAAERRKLPVELRDSERIHLHQERDLTAESLRDLLAQLEDGRHKIVLLLSYDDLQTVAALTPGYSKNKDFGAPLAEAVREREAHPRVHFLFLRERSPDISNVDKSLSWDMSMAQGSDPKLGTHLGLSFNESPAEEMLGTDELRIFNVAAHRSGRDTFVFKTFSTDGEASSPPEARPQSEKPRTVEEPAPHPAAPATTEGSSSDSPPAQADEQDTSHEEDDGDGFFTWD